VKVDAGIVGPLSGARDHAATVEAFGYDGIIAPEISHDPFLPLLMAAESTERIDLITGVAVAFARNPMLLANLGWDLQDFSDGRFILGLGSQIKPHVTRRFSMPWSKPAARMQEMIEAIRAIWECWNNGGRLDFRGDFYSHTLMTPMFDPGPNPHGNPPIMLAGVGPLMTRVAGRVADGFVSHAFQTPEYFRAVTLPALEEGLAESGRKRSDFTVSMPAFVVSGTTQEEADAMAAAARSQIAFYGSTPAYRAVLDHHGWGEAHTELNAMSKRGEWVAMADVIDDQMLDTFALVAEPQHLAAAVAARFGGIVDRIQLYLGTERADVWGPVFDDIKKI